MQREHKIVTDSKRIDIIGICISEEEEEKKNLAFHIFTQGDASFCTGARHVIC